MLSRQCPIRYVSRMSKAILGICLLTILLINIFYAPYKDDFCYMLLSHEKLFSATYQHYMEWNGRVISTFFLYIFSIMPVYAYIILNIVMSIAIIAIPYRIVCKKNDFNSIYCFIASFIFLWFCMPNYGEIFAWRAGATTYLWSAILLLLWFMPYRMLYASQKNTSSVGIIKSIIFLLYSIIVGTSQEITVFSFLLMGAFTLLVHKHKKLNIPVWAFCGIAGLCIGWLILINAPGIAIRSANTLTLAFLIDNFPKAFFLITLAIFPIILLFTFFLYSNYHKNKQFVFSALQLEACVYFCFALINAYGYLVSPQHAGRAFSGSYFITLLAIACIFCDFREKIVTCYEEHKQVVNTIFTQHNQTIHSIVCVCIALFLFSSANTVYAHYKYYVINLVREIQLNEIPRDYTADVVFPSGRVFLNDRSYMIDSGLSLDPDFEYNACFARCKKLKSATQRPTL